MKAKNSNYKVILDKRAMSRYDHEIGIINKLVADLAELLKDNGKPYDNMTVLSVVFVPGWLDSEDDKRLDRVTDPIVKGLLRDFVPRMPQSFTDEVETIRQGILGACVEVSDIRTPLALRETDFTVIDGELVVSPEHRTRFEQSITHELTPEEVDAYNTLATVIPELKRLKSQGWNIVPLVEGRVGRQPFQDGVAGVEHLAEDVVLFRTLTLK